MSNNSPQSSTTTITRFLRHLLSPPRKPPTTPSPSPPPPPLSPNSDDDIHQVFNYFDENGDGKISAAELQRRLRTVGMGELQLSDEEAEMAVRSSDADGDGALGLDDFAKMMKEGEGEEEEVKGAFVMYCDRKGSVITPKSLRKMMRRLGQAATVEDCKTMIGRFDGNGDGVLDYDEFRAMMSL